MRNQGRTSHHTGTDGPAATAGAARWQAPWPDQTPAGGRHGRLPPPAAHFEIEQAITPLAAQVAQLDEIPGIGVTAAPDLIAEIGAGMSRFPTPGHLASWAKFAPRARQSAGRAKAATTGKGSPWPGGTLGEAAAGAARTKTLLASRYKRIVRRRGKNRALVAVGNSLLTIAWHLLSDPAAHFTDLGPTGTTAWPRCAASVSSSPNSNACPATKSPSATPPDLTPATRPRP